MSRSSGWGGGGWQQEVLCSVVPPCPARTLGKVSRTGRPSIEMDQKLGPSSSQQVT